MIILTGASGGIGRALISRLSERYEILGVYNTTKPQPSPNVCYQQLNLEDETAIHQFVERNKKKLSNITLIHGAGISINGLVAQLRVADWDKTLNVNLRSNFILSKALLPFMISDGCGRIIHISSRTCVTGLPGAVAYCASKAGLSGLSNVLANEYGRFNITSNVLVLGAYDTGMFRKKNSREQKIILDFCGGRLGDVASIATLIEDIMVCNDRNGQTIEVNTNNRSEHKQQK